MPRPRLDIGTYGNISVRDLTPIDPATGEHVKGAKEVYAARAWVRLSNGKRRQLERRDTSPAKAEKKLRNALRDIQNTTGSEGASQTLETLSATFLERKRQEGRAQRSLDTYEYGVRIITGPDGIGELTIAEATPARVGAFLRQVKQDRGAGANHTCRSVLSGMFGVAVEDGVIDSNPIKQLSKQKTPKAKGARALTREQLAAIITAIQANTTLVEEDIADVFLLQAHTGLRIGEALALRWEDVDLEAGTLSVTGTMIRVPKVGIRRQERPKTDESARTIDLTPAALDILQHRVHETDLVFPDRLGRPRDPNTVEKLWRLERDSLGAEGVTTHAFRKTVATMLDEAGLSARAIADYLGHAQVSTTQDKYMGRKRDTSAAASALAKIESDE